MNDQMISFHASVPTDYEFLKNVHHSTLKEYVSKIWGWEEQAQDEFFSRDFNSGQIQLIKASRDSVGYLQLNEQKSEIHIVNILILPGFQNRGLGTQIIKNLVVKARNSGQSLKLGVFKVNTRAKSLYERLGFETYDESETHYLVRIS